MEPNINTPQTSGEFRPSRNIVQKIKDTIGIKAAIIIFCILLIIGLGYFFRNLFVAASVNGDMISRLEVINRLEQNGGSQVLDALITESLIRAEAEKKGIVVTDEEIAAEITKIEGQFGNQGTSLDEALTASNLTREDLHDQIKMQKQIEKLLGDTTDVTDAEVAKYITDTKITIPKDQDAAIKAQIKEQLKSEKINLQLDALITNLKGQAKIKYYVQY